MADGKSLIKRDQARVTVSIAASGTTSDPVSADGYALFGAVLPSTFDGTTLEFTVSADGSTYQTLYASDGATKVAMTSLAQGRSYDLPTALAAWPYFRLVADTQTTSATDIVIVKKG
jgi:hypothetical protein